MGAGHPSTATAGAGLAALVLRDGGVAVAVVDPDLALAVEVLVEDVAVAVLPPPRAQLPVPRAVKHMEELCVLHPHHGEKVLVPKVPLEVVLLCQLLHHAGLQQLVVELGLPHGFQVQEQDTTVEARQSVRRGIPHFGLGVLAAILPERVPAKRGTTAKSGNSGNTAATSSPGTYGPQHRIHHSPKGSCSACLLVAGGTQLHRLVLHGLHLSPSSCTGYRPDLKLLLLLSLKALFVSTSITLVSQLHAA